MSLQKWKKDADVVCNAQSSKRDSIGPTQINIDTIRSVNSPAIIHKIAGVRHVSPRTPKANKSLVFTAIDNVPWNNGTLIAQHFPTLPNE